MLPLGGRFVIALTSVAWLVSLLICDPLPAAGTSVVAVSVFAKTLAQKQDASRMSVAVDCLTVGLLSIVAAAGVAAMTISAWLGWWNSRAPGCGLAILFSLSLLLCLGRGLSTSCSCAVAGTLATAALSIDMTDPFGQAARLAFASAAAGWLAWYGRALAFGVASGLLRGSRR
jgi:hypothetical protein